uniref:Transmembrane protein n=1 Tax=Medicago truncatula TaxID=3880 RepID=I3T915_MEDTR|nr:unknown [Medicago truncatula]
MLGFWYQILLLVLLLVRVVQQSLIFSHNLEHESSCHAIMNSSLEPLIGLSWYLVQSMKY